MSENQPLKLTRLDSQEADFGSRLNKLLHRDQAVDVTIEQTVAEIIDHVRRQGDAALFDYTRRFDRFDVSSNGLELPTQRLQQALQSIPSQQREALEYAAQRVNDYHLKQRQESWRYSEADGTQLGQKVTPLKRVGLYVPGGKAAYPSSVLMSAIPAKVAGVEQLIMVTPTPEGQCNDMVLAAAAIAGVDTVLTIGGAQAVAALAYGTQSVPAVDKIVGPGNIYVATAKKHVFGQVGIDMIAGPSEVLVIADDSVNPDWVAMDLFAQAEHDEMAQSIVISMHQDVLQAVQESVNSLLPSMERADIIEQSLMNNGAMILAASEDDLINITDQIAPEHLEVFTHNAEQLADKISHAGAIFIGPYSAESLGDYCAGPSHVLPTAGTARFSSPLGVYDFQKRTSIIHCSQSGAQSIAKHAATMARGESLTAHARSAEFRLKESSS